MGGMMYVGSFLVVLIPYIVTAFFYDTNPTMVQYTANFFIPLQGVLNALVYSNFFTATAVAFKKGASFFVEHIIRSVHSSSLFLSRILGSASTTTSTQPKAPATSITVAAVADSGSI